MVAAACLPTVFWAQRSTTQLASRHHLPSVLTCNYICVHCHKWALGSKGSAFLYARREVQHLLEPLVVSWGWNRGDEVAGLLDLGVNTSRFIDEQEWQGTRDPAAYLSVPAAIQFQAEHDWPRVRQECHACACAQVQASCCARCGTASRS